MCSWEIRVLHSRVKGLRRTEEQRRCQFRNVLRGGIVHCGPRKVFKRIYMNFKEKNKVKSIYFSQIEAELLSHNKVSYHLTFSKEILLIALTTGKETEAKTMLINSPQVHSKKW